MGSYGAVKKSLGYRYASKDGNDKKTLGVQKYTRA